MWVTVGIMVEHAGLRHLMMPIHVLTLTPTLVNIYGPVILTTVMCCVCPQIQGRDSPLIWAAMNGQSTTVEVLLNHGATVDLENKAMGMRG